MSHEFMCAIHERPFMSRSSWCFRWRCLGGLKAPRVPRFGCLRCRLHFQQQLLFATDVFRVRAGRSIALRYAETPLGGWGAAFCTRGV